MQGIGYTYIRIEPLAQRIDAYGKNSFPGKGNPKLTDEQREIAELKKRLRDAELERDILKKAIAIFS